MSTEPTQDDSTERADDSGPSRRKILAATGVVLGGGLVSKRVYDGASAESDSTTYQGLRHDPLGGATLSTSDGQLTASGFDDGGGIETSTGRTMQWSADVTPTISQMPVGGSLTTSAFGTMEGEPGQPAGDWSLTRTEEGVAFSGEFANTTMSGDVGYQVLNGTEQTLYREPDPGTQMVIDVNDIPWWIWLFLEFQYAYQTGPDSPVVASCQSLVHLGATTDVTIGGDTVRGDRLAIIETTDGHDHEVYYTTEMRTTGSGLDEITFDDEDVRLGAMFNGTVNFARDSATLTRTSDTLEVEGGAGTRIWGGTAETITATLDSLVLDQSGQRLDVSGVGTVDGEDDRSLGTASVGHKDSRLAVDADFSAVDADGVGVAVYDGGSKVGGDTLASGTVAHVDGTPGVAATAGTVADGPGFGVSFDGTTTVVLGSGEKLTGDEIRLAAANPSATVTDVGGFDVDATDVGGFTVLGESVQ